MKNFTVLESYGHEELVQCNKCKTKFYTDACVEQNLVYRYSVRLGCDILLPRCPSCGLEEIDD